MHQGGIETRDGVVICVCGDLVLSIWRDPVTVENWKFQRDCVDRALTLNRSVLVVSVIDQRSSPPDSRLRAIIQEDFDRWGPRMRRCITGVVNDSIYAPVVRAFVSASKSLFYEGITECLSHIRHYATPATPSNREVLSCFTHMQERIGLSIVKDDTLVS